jgi:type I restriction enzyme S subunit
VPFPPLGEQRRIAAVLGALDDLIEGNSAVAQRLTALARAIYDGTVEAGASTIPFAETVTVISGGTPKTSVSEYWGGDIPWYSVVDAPEGASPWVLATSKTITAEGLANSPARLLPEGTTIISARGTVGKLALVGVPMAMNQSCYGLRSLVGERGIFSFFSAQDIVKDLRQSAHGSVFDTITRESLMRVAVRVPEPSDITAFESKAAPLLDLARELTVENVSLARTRDELLPLLMSNNIRVSEDMVVA